MPRDRKLPPLVVISALGEPMRLEAPAANSTPTIMLASASRADAAARRRAHYPIERSFASAALADVDGGSAATALAAGASDSTRASESAPAGTDSAAASASLRPALAGGTHPGLGLHAPRRAATSSAATLTAISSGVLAP